MLFSIMSCIAICKTIVCNVMMNKSLSNKTRKQTNKYLKGALIND